MPHKCIYIHIYIYIIYTYIYHIYAYIYIYVYIHIYIAQWMPHQWVSCVSHMHMCLTHAHVSQHMCLTHAHMSHTCTCVEQAASVCTAPNPIWVTARIWMSHGTQKKESYQSSRTHGHDMHRAHAQSKSPPSSPHSTPPSPRTSRANATIRKNAQSHRHVPRRRSREGGEWEGGSLYCRDHPAREKPGRNPQNVSLLLNWLPWGKDECTNHIWMSHVTHMMTNQRCAANLNLKFEFAPSPFEICIADLCLYHVPWRSTTLIQV